MSNEIIMKVTLIRGTQKQEQTISTSRVLFNSLSTKEKLLRFVFEEVFYDLGEKSETFYENCRAERKSKKHRKFVSLEVPDDFKELMRSLKVKNHVKLIVYAAVGCEAPIESPVADALEQIKKLVNDLQKSEMWEVLRSLANYSVKAESGMRASDESPQSKSCESEESSGEFYDGKFGWVVHENIACDSCHPGETFSDICGKRFKCMVCRDFDLCGKCYDARIVKGNHRPDHPMIAIEDSLVYRECFRPGASHCPSSVRHAASAPNDIFFDIPLKKCTFENRRLIEQMLVRGEISDFFSEVDGFIDRASKYSEIESLVPAEVNDKFDYLKKLFTEEAQAVPEKDELPAMLSLVTLNDKIDGGVEAILKSNTEIPVGEISIKVEDENSSKFEESSEIPYTMSEGCEHPLLMSLNKSAANLSGTTWTVKQSGQVLMQEKYHGHSDPTSSTLAGPASNDESFVLNSNFSDDDVVEVVVTPKSNGLSQLHITNKSAKTIHCLNLELRIVNCFDTVVASVAINKAHGILSGRSAKFNIPVNNAHFKFPFKVWIRSETISGVCSLSLKSLSGSFKFSNTYDEESLKEQMEALQEVVEKAEVDEFAEASLANSTGSASYHSIVIPVLPKETSMDSSQATADFYEAETVEEDEASDEDYDMISVGDAEDAPSDYEVLSPTNSYEN